MKFKFKSDDNLPLGKILNIHVCIIVVRSVFKKTIIIHKFIYTNLCACMSINIKMKMILIPLYK